MAKIKKCKFCKKEYDGRGKYFCSISCKNKYFSGKKSATWKGGFPKCIDCKKELKRRNAKRCKACAALGKLGNNWKGGITKIYISVRNCAKYKKWRKDVYKKDGYTCQVCGIKNGMGKRIYLNADHYPIKFSNLINKYKIKNVSEANKCKELWNINNGRTLCLECHSKIDNFSIKFKR